VAEITPPCSRPCEALPISAGRIDRRMRGSGARADSTTRPSVWLKVMRRSNRSTSEASRRCSSSALQRCGGAAGG
jgi:hypothetical protein